MRAHRTPLMSPRPHTISDFVGRARHSLEDPSYRRLPTLYVASRSASRQHDKDNGRTMTHHRSRPVADRRAPTQHITPAWASLSIVTSAKIAAANFLNRHRYASVVHSQQPGSHRARPSQTARLEANNCCTASAPLVSLHAIRTPPSFRALACLLPRLPDAAPAAADVASNGAEPLCDPHHCRVFTSLALSSLLFRPRTRRRLKLLLPTTTGCPLCRPSLVVGRSVERGAGHAFVASSVEQCPIVAKIE